MPRVNNFDILRLLLAWIIVVVHCCSLSASPALDWILRNVSSAIPIEGFFAISGCLIVASFERSSSLGDYFLRRAERLLPGYYAATIFALVIGIAMTTLPIRDFLFSPNTWKFLGANVILLNGLHTDLPGVFEHNPTMANVDGALWTIKIEVGFYLFVPIFVWLCRRFGRALILALCFGGSVLYRILVDRSGHWADMHGRALERQLPGQLAFFMVGAAVYFYYPRFAKHRHWMWSLGGLSYLLSLATGIFAFRALGVPLLILCVGFLLPAYKGPTRFGDFSYGAYVLHYPVVQTLVALGLFTVAPYRTLCIAIFIIAALSVASWNYVEKVFLRRQRVKATETDVPSLEASARTAAYLSGHTGR